MIDTRTGMDLDVLTRVIQSHVEQYAVSVLGQKQADEITSREEALVGVIERILWDNRTEFGGTHGTVASLMFAGGFELALQLVAGVTPTPLRPDIPAIGKAFDRARAGIDYTIASVRRTNEIDAARAAEGRGNE